MDLRWHSLPEVIARFGLFLRQLGLVITRQASPTNPIFNSENLGVSMVIFGIALIALAAWRYSQVFWQIERGDYQPSHFTVLAMTGIVIILGILSIPLLLVRDREIITPASPSKSLKSNQFVLKIDLVDRL